MTVTEDRIDLNGSRSTSHFENETWVEKPWKKFEIVVFRLQKRIYKASQEGNFRKVKKLQRLLLKCRSAKFLAVRQITQLNTGKKTPGIDGIANLNDAERIQLVEELQGKSRNWNHREVIDRCINRIILVICLALPQRKIIDQFMSFGKSSALRRFPCRSSRCAWVQELDTEKSGD